MKSQILKNIALLTGLSLLITMCYYKTTKLPGIIFIFTDVQGYCDLSFYSVKQIQTPDLDKLAKDSIKFTDFHAASSISSPSKTALLIGCYSIV